MTPAELCALDFIRGRIGATGCAPTLDEIAGELGWHAKSNAHRVVDSLVRQGALDRDPHKARGLTLPRTPALSSIPTAELHAEIARRGGASSC